MTFFLRISTSQTSTKLWGTLIDYLGILQFMPLKPIKDDAKVRFIWSTSLIDVPKQWNCGHACGVVQQKLCGLETELLVSCETFLRCKKFPKYSSLYKARGQCRRANQASEQWKKAKKRKTLSLSLSLSLSPQLARGFRATFEYLENYEYLKIICVNYGVNNYMKEDYRSYIHNFCSCEKKDWKKFRLVRDSNNPKRSAIPALYQLTSQLGVGLWIGSL